MRSRGTVSILYRVNAGRIATRPLDPGSGQGGGRIIGEVCHFVDLMQFLDWGAAGFSFCRSFAGNKRRGERRFRVHYFGFADGSNGSIAYLAEGDNALAKERVEIFGDGKTFVLDDFRRASLYHNGQEEKTVLRAQDKGQAEK